MILTGIFAMIASNRVAARHTVRALVRRLPRFLVGRVARFLPTPAIVRAASRHVLHMRGVGQDQAERAVDGAVRDVVGKGVT